MVRIIVLDEPVVWNAVVATAVIIAIVALIATQREPEATEQARPFRYDGFIFAEFI